VSRAYDAFARQDVASARSEAKSAHALNPLAVEPLWALALAEPGGKALELYRQARDLEPKNPETWFQLGAFELDALLRPRAAYRDLNHAYTLDRYMFGPEAEPGRTLDRARCLIDPATCP
jgi:tetratricopeptide (TPR) repeat protein